jgi:SHS2 domain-containing protein
VIEPPAGYNEIEHTADWMLEVWAPDLPQLMEQAARGMYALARVELAAGPHHERRIEIEGTDAESLLVGFLAELLFISEQEGLAFADFHMEVEGSRLTAIMHGMPIRSLEKDIKAVTYHNLSILRTADGLKVRIVFDV